MACAGTTGFGGGWCGGEILEKLERRSRQSNSRSSGERTDEAAAAVLGANVRVYGGWRAGYRVTVVVDFEDFSIL